MKFFASIIGILLVGFSGSGLIAGQVYTWTDENGNLHVTDTPPPPKSRLKDTLEYQEKTPPGIRKMQQPNQNGRVRAGSETLPRLPDGDE